jgi:ABC-type Fe3+/spermidine/putrescine transport system ATPase subunit
MFQDYALFPHLTVGENVAFGLRMKRAPNAAAITREMLVLVGLADFEHRDVNTLSGGEQQRVALARSLAPRPRLLMLDEPLGALDRSLRERLVTDLRGILRRLRQTAIYVTHDLEEAFALADRVAVMNAGRIEQIGSPQELFGSPATPFVAKFLGFNNLLGGMVTDQTVITSLGQFPAPGCRDGPVTALIRPERIRLSVAGAALQGIVVERSFRGNTCRTVIETRGVRLTFDAPGGAAIPPEGEIISIEIDASLAVQTFS